MTTPEWISVKDRLPDSERYVWAMLDDGRIVPARCDYGKRLIVFNSSYSVAVAWTDMPLPQPPKQESSFEKWWGALPPADDALRRYIGFNTACEAASPIRKSIANVIWSAAIAASKKPDFVE
jgi:hypothetical protein